MVESIAQTSNLDNSLAATTLGVLLLKARKRKSTRRPKRVA